MKVSVDREEIKIGKKIKKKQKSQLISALWN
jgi:hypothetical protein